MSDQNQQWHPYQQQASQPSANDPWAVSQPSASQPSANDPYLAGQPSANDPYPTAAQSPYGAPPQQGWEQAAPPAHASYTGQSPQHWEQQTQVGYPPVAHDQQGYGHQANDPYATHQGYQQDPYAPQQSYPQQDPYAPQQSYPQQDPYAPQQSYPQQDPYAPQQGYAQQDPYAPQQGYAQQDPYAPQSGSQPAGFPPNAYAQAPVQPSHPGKESGFGTLFSLSFDKPVAAKIGPTLFIIAMVSAGLTALRTIVLPLLDYNSPLHFTLGLLSAPVYALLFIGLVRLGIEGAISLSRLCQESREMKELLNDRSDADADA